MTQTAQEKHREYMKQYRKAHREELNAYARKWRSENKEKSKEYIKNYWDRKAQEGGTDAENN